MLQKITRTQRLVCFALAATVVFQVPMMKMGSDKARPFTPVSVVASQLALPIPDAPGKPGDPGDLLRAIMYPGELVWGAWDAYVCATSAEACAADKASWTPDWNTFLKVSELKGIDRRLTRVFGAKKSQIIAGSFFSIGASFQALTRGNAGTLGIFSAVVLLWGLVGAAADGSATPTWGLFAYLASVYATMNITAQQRAARAWRREAARETSQKAAEKAKEEEEAKKKK